MTYVNGAVLAVPTKNKAIYLEHAKVSNEVFKSHGAVQVVDCWGDEVSEGKVTSFPQAVQLKEDETVVFSWVMWPSKEAAQNGMEAAMQDERWKDFGQPPFDGSRMIFGSFETLVE
jgi:uncharacterized protein YbaA (DUF1428 family)